MLIKNKGEEDTRDSKRKKIVEDKTEFNSNTMVEADQYYYYYDDDDEGDRVEVVGGRTEDVLKMLIHCPCHIVQRILMLNNMVSLLGWMNLKFFQQKFQ